MFQKYAYYWSRNCTSKSLINIKHKIPNLLTVDIPSLTFILFMVGKVQKLDHFYRFIYILYIHFKTAYLHRHMFLIILKKNSVNHYFLMTILLWLMNCLSEYQILKQYPPHYESKLFLRCSNNFAGTFSNYKNRNDQHVQIQNF